MTFKAKRNTVDTTPTANQNLPMSSLLTNWQNGSRGQGSVNCLHPGVVRTGFGKDVTGLMSILVRVGSPFMMSPEKSARAAIYLATSPELEGSTGKHFSRGKEERSSTEPYDAASAERLWSVSAKLTRLNA